VVLRTLVQPFHSLKHRFLASFFFFFSSFPPHRFHLAVRGSGKSILLNSHHDHNNFRNRRCRAQLPKIPAAYTTVHRNCIPKSVVHLNKTRQPLLKHIIITDCKATNSMTKALMHNHENTSSTIEQKISSDIPPSPL